MKHNIEFMTCNNCGAHIYPPTEVSDIGIEDYEEVFEAPPVMELGEAKKWLGVEVSTLS
jgi:uncharacterized OB-fold protein